MDHGISSLNNDDCVFQRPAYSRYQIANLIKSKKRETGFTTKELAKLWDMPEDMVRLIEEGRRSLNTTIYKKISDFVKIGFSELTKVYIDTNCYSFRRDSEGQSEDTKETVKLANMIFHEMLGQKALTGKV